MRLTKLTLSNFKGIEKFCFVPDGNDADIYGANATGKTSVADAFCWLLTDKDSLNSAQFGIKTLVDGAAVNNVEHEVEGIFDVDSKTITLKKVFSEKWTKKRGAAQADFTGHTTDYFVNGVPVKLKGYQEKIAAIAPPELFRLLTSPRFVNEEMKWDARRRLLIDVCGDVSDADVIATNPDHFERILAMISGKTADEYRTEIAYKKTGINKELQSIPVRIDELSKSMPADHILDATKMIADKAAATTAISVLRNKISLIESGGEVGIKKAELQEIRNQIAAFEATERRKEEDRAAKLRGAEREAREAVLVANHRKSALSSEIGKIDAAIAMLDTQIKQLRDLWHERNGFRFEPPQVANTCPTCGQTIPESQIAETIETAKADFNISKSAALSRIQADGKQWAAELKTAKARQAGLIKQLSDATIELGSLEEIHAATKQALDAPHVRPNPCPEHFELLGKAGKIEAELSEMAIGNRDATSALYAEIETAETTLAAINNQLAEIEASKKAKARIAELMTEEKKLAAEYERLEADLHLLEEFTRAKCNLLTDRINSKFQITKFRLFENQINLGLRDTCIAMVDGVPYSDLNNAMKIRCGADIVRTLQKHYGVHPPIWFDNKESVIGPIEMDCQIINLIVSEEDKTLRVAVEKKSLENAA